tara:strand:+ start:4200 stop:4748 length:549 start_codon:yes stop_codon:yes gene_type:complete
MKYCSNCGGEVELKTPEGDNRDRYCCPDCSSIHYQNPKLVVGTLPVEENKILLCRRGINPRYGLWTLPAGFLENGETIVEGAFRETLEETSTEVEIQSLYTIFDIPHISQIYLIYLARLKNHDFGPTAESLEVQLFDESEIPWNELAFPFVERALVYYFKDQKNSTFTLKNETIEVPYKPKS